ncbi:hypothetical protein LRP88_10602 [Fusarium phalaenopsidis]
MPPPKVDAPALLELARGLQEGALAQFHVTEPQYQGLITLFCSGFHRGSYVEAARGARIKSAYGCIAASHIRPLDLPLLPIDILEKKGPAIKSVLEQRRAKRAPKMDDWKKLIEAYQRELDGPIAATEINDTEVGLCLVNELATMRAFGDDVLHQHCVRSRMIAIHLHGLWKEQLEFVDVTTKAISEHMVAKEDGGSAVGVGRDE